MNPAGGLGCEERTVGRDSIRKSFERWASDWESLEVTAEACRRRGPRTVTIRHTGRGRRSGVDTEARYFAVLTLREGKVARVDEFLQLAEALEAAGLSE
jgi:ketosteroid isomerase-like protein